MLFKFQVVYASYNSEPSLIRQLHVIKLRAVFETILSEFISKFFPRMCNKICIYVRNMSFEYLNDRYFKHACIRYFEQMVRHSPTVNSLNLQI